MFIKRSEARAAVAKGNIYVTSGRSNWRGDYPTVEFTPQNGKNKRWTLTRTRMNLEGESFGLAWFNGALFEVGGMDDNNSNKWLEDANPWKKGEYVGNEGEYYVPIDRIVQYFKDLVIL